MQTVTIRSRGQITIPERIRTITSWIRVGSVVSVYSDEEEICIKPYNANAQTVNWDDVWEKILLLRSFKGKKGNLSDFIVSDRESH